MKRHSIFSERFSTRLQCGFTLVELLVVISIIGILMSLTLPAIQSARETGRRTQCANTMKQIALASINYSATYNAFPSGSKIDFNKNCTADCRGVSVFVLILPYHEEAQISELYKPFLKTSRGWIDWSDPATNPNWKVSAPFYICPSEQKYSDAEDPERLRRSYFGVTGGVTKALRNPRGDVFRDGMLYINSGITNALIRDGASKTLLVGESLHPAIYGMGAGYGIGSIGGPCPWYEGSATNKTMTGDSVGRQLRSTKFAINIEKMPMAPGDENDVPFGSSHVAGATFCFADGHVDYLTDDTDFVAYQALSTRSSGDN